MACRAFLVFSGTRLYFRLNFRLSPCHNCLDGWMDEVVCWEDGEDVCMYAHTHRTPYLFVHSHHSHPLLLLLFLQHKAETEKWTHFRHLSISPSPSLFPLCNLPPTRTGANDLGTPWSSTQLAGGRPVCVHSLLGIGLQGCWGRWGGWIRTGLTSCFNRAFCLIRRAARTPTWAHNTNREA